MFTDIVGYTTMMGKDKQKALTMLQKNRELHKTCIEKNDGKLLKEMGDGVNIAWRLVMQTFVSLPLEFWWLKGMCSVFLFALYHNFSTEKISYEFTLYRLDHFDIIWNYNCFN